MGVVNITSLFIKAGSALGFRLSIYFCPVFSSFPVLVFPRLSVVIVTVTVYHLCLCQEPPTEGTVKPYPSFNAETDAKTLRTAMKGFGMLVTIDT